MGKFRRNNLHTEGSTVVEGAAFALRRAKGGKSPVSLPSKGREVPSGASSTQGLSEGSDRESPQNPLSQNPSSFSLHSGTGEAGFIQGLTHPCEQLFPALCSESGDPENCPLQGLPREWCILCLRGSIHEQCLGVRPPTHPCERVWGFCRYGDRCMYKDMPSIWCLRCLRGMPHAFCDLINPNTLQDTNAIIQPKAAPTRDRSASLSTTFDSFKGEHEWNESHVEEGEFNAPQCTSPEKDTTHLSCIIDNGEVIEAAQPTYSARKAARNRLRQLQPAFEGAYPSLGRGSSFPAEGSTGASPSPLYPGEFADRPQTVFFSTFGGSFNEEPQDLLYDEGAVLGDDESQYWETEGTGTEEIDSRGYPAADAVPRRGVNPKRATYEYHLGFTRDPYWEGAADQQHASYAGSSHYAHSQYATTGNDDLYYQDYVYPAETWPELPHQAENPFKVQADEDERDIVAKKVQGILNRITPEKYDILSQQLVALLSPFMAEETEVATDVCKEVSWKIFEKAIGEPHNSVMYADLVQLLHTNQQKLSQERRANGKPSADHSIRTLILNRCQRQFYSTAEKSEDQGESEVMHDRHRKRCQGNARLVAEVYLRKLLPIKIVEEVIEFLIQDQKTAFPDRMEVLCTLLSVAGPQIDWSRPVLVDCWRRVQDMCSAEDTIPRIKFLLQDLMELRAGAWAPRRTVLESPKKLAEVRKCLPRRHASLGGH
eukprot:GGOE01009248.1.p1 GENE.GGOE01009248.1~~GGOE01009248.1.p1  ORF type:complete len:724 (+),score=84.40 GGOE01009248.1:36-2174(+)